MRLFARATIGAVIGLAVLVAGLATYADHWPPITIVNSMSMMHRSNETPPGRLGTLDPGDLTLTRALSAKDSVHVWAMHEYHAHGADGDVIVFHVANRSVAVIHRAMTYVDVLKDENGTLAYRVAWSLQTPCPEASSRLFADEPSCYFASSGITSPDLGLLNYTPAASGYITKGDNPVTNTVADQQGGPGRTEIFGPVQVEQIDGRAVGEVPWIGLANLALRPTYNEPSCADRAPHLMLFEKSPWCLGWIGLGHAYAPRQTWGWFFGAIILLPALLIGGEMAAKRLVLRKRKAEPETPP